MDKHATGPSAKSCSKNRPIGVDNLKFKDQSDKEFLEQIKTPLALKELNCITREKLNAVQNAQRKWVENLENWSTTDEIQKAQLKWIEKFSSFPKFNTIDSPDLTKSWKFPFSPPRSSSDLSPRRGFCVYEPGSNKQSPKKLECSNEHTHDIKVAQLQEQKKVQHVTPEKAKISASIFSPFPESKSEETIISPTTDQASKKRHITLRKKLYCSNRLEKDEAAKEKRNSQTPPKSKSENHTPDKEEEDRRAARKYIHRKRVERDRKLREQREQEERAEQERRARMERLRETQHRILVNATKKSKQVLKKKESWIGLVDKNPEEDKPLSREMEEPPEYTGPHITGAIPFLADRTKKNSSEDSKSLPPSSRGKYLPNAPTGSGDWNRETNVPASREKVIPGKKFVEDDSGNSPLSSAAYSITSKALDEMGKEESSETLTPIRLNDLPLEKPVTPSLLSTPICNKLSKESLVSQSSLGCAYLFNNSEISSAHTMDSLSQRSLIQDVEPPSKLFNDTIEDESLLNIASSVAEAKKKEIYGDDKQGDWNNSNNKTIFSSSVNMLPSNQYNLFAAISNKRLAYKEVGYESPKKQPKTFPLFEDSSIQTIDLPVQPCWERKDMSEKGIQCHVESVGTDTHDAVSSSDHMDSYSSSSCVKLTKSERLKKPNLILLPGRSSDPCVYSEGKFSISDFPGESHSRPKLSLDHTAMDHKISYTPPKKDNVQSFQSKFSETTPKLELTGYHHLKDNREQKGKPTENVISLNVTHRSSNQQNEHEFSLNSILNSTRNSVVDSEIKEQIDLQIRNQRKLSSEPLKELLSDYFRDTISWRGDKNILKDPIKENIAVEEEDMMKKSSVSDLSFAMSRDTSLAKSSSSVLEYGLKEDNMGFISFAKFSLNMFMDLLKEESSRSKQQEYHFRMRENSIIDKTKAEIAYLEIEKKKFKASGNEEGVRNIRKKIRGLVIKLQQNLEDLQLVKKMEKSASRGRRRLLLEKIDLMRDQLKKQMEATRMVKKESLDSSHSSLEYRKELQKDHQITAPYDSKNDTSRILPVSMTSETPNRDNEIQDSQPIEKLKVEENERRVKELEALVVESSYKGKDTKQRNMVERATSPHHLSSDDERKKGDYSCSDTLDLLSTSSQHEKLEEKDARKMVALKVPLSPRVTLKRRHSSGSDESWLLSQTETQSDASDMETRVLALQQQLKQRKAELESLHREYKKSQRERLIAKEQSLLSQIQAYDAYIDQVRRDLDKEREGSEVKIVKPVIKHPKLACERRKSDTWLLQGRRGCRNSGTPSDETSSCKAGLFKKEKECCKNKIAKDRLLDSQAIDKLSLKADYSNEKPCIVDSGESAAVDSNIVIPCKVLKSKLSIDVEEILASAKSSESSDSVQMLKSDKPTTTSEEKRLLNLIKSSQNDEPSFSNYKDDKVSSVSNYKGKGDEVLTEEKLNSSSLQFYERSDKNSIKNSTSLESSVTDKYLSLSMQVTSMDETEVKKDETNVLSGSFDLDPSGSGPAVIKGSKGYSSEIEKKLNLDSAVEIIKMKVTELLDEDKEEQKEVDDSLSNGGTVSGSSEEINQTEDNVSMKGSKSITEINKKTEENNSVMSNEVMEENLSIEEVKDITSEIENHISISEVHNKDNLIEESIKEDIEMLSEIPESIVKSEVINTSNENKSSDKEVSELLSAYSKGTNNESKITEEVDTNVIETLKEVSESVEVEETSEKSQSKNVSLDEEIASVVDSEEFTSGTSFPLPILSKQVRETTIPDVNLKGSLADQQSESVLESEHSDDSNQDQKLSSANEVEFVKTQTEDSKTESGKTDSVIEDVKSVVEESLKEIEESLKEIEESVKEVEERFERSSLNDHTTSPISEHVPEDFEDLQELDRSITESLVDTTLGEAEESFYADLKLKTKRNLIEEDEDVDSNDSYLDDKEMYSFLKEEGKERVAAPLIDALQREGDSALDQVWRSIADAAVNDATDLILSRFFNRTDREECIANDRQVSIKEVGDNDDDWDSEELRRQAAEAEVLRLQQLRIDKEIEELEEEEARRYYYIRPIPDKPPPPYTPRRSSLVASVVEAAGEIWDGRTEMPPTFMAGCHLREFIWDLAAELVMRVRPRTPSPQPPWVHIRKRRPKRQIRTKEELLEEVEKEAKIYLGVEERECRENLIIRWSRKRRDHVDEILVKESQEEEWEWTDYSEEENLIKNRIADAIIQDSIVAATSAIAEAFVKKFKNDSEH